MTLTEAKREFCSAYPNLRVNGWDERDYDLWGKLQSLPSWGLIAGDVNDPMISRKHVIALLEEAAEARFEQDWKARFGRPTPEKDTPWKVT
jgi:hypothetical protein